MLSRLLLDLFVSTNTVTSATKATSAQDVFGIYELLEGILLHLPLYNMLLAVTTCRHWLHVASTSSEIRSRLLLDYIPRYARLQPSSRVSEDLCNEDSSTPWFFRTAVEGGTIVILRLKCEKVQVFVPRDVNAAFRLLDNQGMLVSEATISIQYTTLVLIAAEMLQVATRQTVQSRISRVRMVMGKTIPHGQHCSYLRL